MSLDHVDFGIDTFKILLELKGKHLAALVNRFFGLRFLYFKSLLLLYALVFEIYRKLVKMFAFLDNSMSETLT